VRLRSEALENDDMVHKLCSQALLELACAGIMQPSVVSGANLDLVPTWCYLNVH
jgi:hypothetical protein